MIKSYIKTFASLLFIQYFHITSHLNSQVNYFEQQFICRYLIQEILSGLGFAGRSCIIPLLVLAWSSYEHKKSHYKLIEITAKTLMSFQPGSKKENSSTNFPTNKNLCI